MKTIFVEIKFQGWERIDNKVLCERYNIPIPGKGNTIYINNEIYKVENISYHLYTNDSLEEYVKIEVTKPKI